jgi:hydrogenase maturation protein HypF
MSLASSSPSAPERRRLLVRGTVQGVGFRPFVWRLAREEGLAGWVRNGAGGVEIEAEGAAERLRTFALRLRAEAPPLARIDGVELLAIAPSGERGFGIRESRAGGPPGLPVSADAAPCAACVAEVADPRSRRHGYPFTNCTDCGPRFTIIEALPYDRARTTMRAFALCAACRAEYGDPADRRFHAEPIACPDCGPRLALRSGAGDAVGGALEAAVAALRAGAVVAVKGLGGFQLACDARDPAAVGRLRARKRREAKPFAVMVADLEAARALCRVSAEEAEALTGPAAPIVLLRRRRPAGAGPGDLADGVAPGLGSLGVMLPGSPLHHLLLQGFGGPLVMTSGNRSEEPIAVGEAEAEERLRGIADAFLLHDRGIVSRYDDSVVRVAAGAPVVLRRARGLAPAPIRLARAAPVRLLGVGAQLKGAFCLARGREAFLSQHIGDLDDALTRAHYLETLGHYRRLFGIDPEVVAHDLHPDYATTAIAGSLEGVRTVAVQHHHAHVASCLMEHGHEGPAIGVALDGAGYGSDGAVWGGELLVVEGAGFRRVAHLAYLPLPGGEMAAREPWRMAVAALAHSCGAEAESLAAALLSSVPAALRGPVLRLALGALPTPRTSSMGRLFDAVAALAGVRTRNLYEGQAAMELEACADPRERGRYPLPLRAPDGGGPAVWDPAPLVRAVVDDVRRGAGPARVAGRFHNALAGAVLEGCLRERDGSGLTTVALSGGCFQNRRLLEAVRRGLRHAGFRVLTHGRVPPNDGGIALGQVAVALATTDS